MNNNTKLTVSITRSGHTIHVSASKGGEPLTPEDHLQLQILEYQATNTSEGLTGNSPITLDRRQEYLRASAVNAKAKEGGR